VSAPLSAKELYETSAVSVQPCVCQRLARDVQERTRAPAAQPDSGTVPGTACGLRKPMESVPLLGRTSKGDFVPRRNVGNGRLSGPKAQQFIQRRAEPW